MKDTITEVLLIVMCIIAELFWVKHYQLFVLQVITSAMARTTTTY